MNKKLTHNELVEIGAKFLMRKYPIVLTEISVWSMTVPIYETPDLLGFSYNNSILVEVKISLSDLKKDKEKIARNRKEGVGEYKYYLFPEKLYEKALQHIPEEWGIMLFNKNNRIRKRRNSKHFKISWGAERHFLLSALRRLEIKETEIVKIIKTPTRAKRRNIYLNENNINEK